MNTVALITHYLRRKWPLAGWLFILEFLNTANRTDDLIFIFMPTILAAIMGPVFLNQDIRLLRQMHALALLPMSKRKLANIFFFESVIFWPTVSVCLLAFSWLIVALDAEPSFDLINLLKILPLGWIIAGIMHFVNNCLNKVMQSLAFVGIISMISLGFIGFLPPMPLLIAVGLLITIWAWYKTPAMISPKPIRRASFDLPIWKTSFVNPTGRWWPLLKPFLIGFGLSLIPWLVSLFCPDAALGHIIARMNTVNLVFILPIGMLYGWTQVIRALRSLPVPSRHLTAYYVLFPICLMAGWLPSLTVLSIWTGDHQFIMQMPALAILSIAIPILSCSLQLRGLPGSVAASPLVAAMVFLPGLVTGSPLSETILRWVLASALPALLALAFSLYWLQRTIIYSSRIYRSRNGEEA